MKDKEIVQKEIIQIHPGLIVLREHEKGNIYPQGIIRIMVKDNFVSEEQFLGGRIEGR